MANRQISLSGVFKVGVLLIAWITIANAQSANPKPKPTGSISGRVTIDGNAAAGIPVAAVSGESVNRRNAAARAVSDVQGYYLISGLDPGQYQIWTLTPSMIAEPGAAPNYFNFSGAVKNILLGANEDVQSIDLKLIRGAVITGRVINADNKPVVDEHVYVQVLDPNGAPRFGAIGSNDEMYQTDDRGIYRIFDLPPGRYKVSIGTDPDEGIPRGQRYQRTFYPDTNDPSKATIVELKEGDEAKNIDIKVEPARPTYVASGRVIDSESGLPIPKAGVSIMIAPKGPGPATPGSGMQADDRGQFNFSGIAPGRYAAYATSQFYGGNFYGDPVYFEIADKDVSGIELKTVPGLSMSGVLVADGISTKDLLARLPGLRVQARSTSAPNDKLGSGGSSAIAPDGSFQIDGLRPGRVSINLFSSNMGFTQGAIARIEHDGIGINQGFDIQQSISGLRVVMNYGTGMIRGVVKLEGDLPIADLQMSVTCRREGAREYIGVQVDARGHFLIKNLSPGTYEVMAYMRPRVQSQPNRPTPPQKQVVNVTNGSESEANFVFDFRPSQGGP